MPVVRPFPTPTAVSVAEVDTDGAAATGDGEADGDDTAYCYCQKSSYGEMIACDGKDCEREWVSRSWYRFAVAILTTIFSSTLGALGWLLYRQAHGTVMNAVLTRRPRRNAREEEERDAQAALALAIPPHDIFLCVSCVRPNSSFFSYTSELTGPWLQYLAML